MEQLFATIQGGQSPTPVPVKVSLRVFTDGRGVSGWEGVPLLCAGEIAVASALPRCIRVLIHWNTERPSSQVRHAFLRGAKGLRPEWAVRVEEEAEGA